MEKICLKTVAFIFARGGSKGLPGKNIKFLNGKPLLQYSIETAKAVASIDYIVVSTDCNEIAEVAKANGAYVIMRPSELATDTSPEWLSWRHAITHVNEHIGHFDIFVSLPATSPLRNSTDVISALDKLRESKADICISVTEASRSPYFNMVRILEDDSLELAIKSDIAVTRRQEVPEIFDITTVVYAAPVKFIMENSSIFDGKVVAVTVPKVRAVDIDDIYDFMFAEAIMKSGAI